MSRRGKITVVVVLALVTILAGTALAVTNLAFKLGTISKYDFGGFGPGYPVPGLIQIQAFKLSAGETVPWHFHKGVSYVILVHGSLTENHIVARNQCASETVTGGSAFVEAPGQVHTVTNTGTDDAVIWWATIYPKADGPGGIYPATAPSCN